MKKLLLLLLLPLLGFGCQQKLGVVSISSLDTQQINWIKTHPKYLEVPRTTVNGITYWVEEEQMPNGVGYKLFIKNADGSITVKGGGLDTSNYLVPAPPASSTL